MKSLLLIVAIIIADQATKFWVITNFSLYESREIVPGLFNLTYILNTGAAFGFLSGEYAAWRQILFVTVALCALGFMALTYKGLKRQGTLFAFAICLIAGGAAGNLIDRLRLGAVIDFLDFYVNQYHWPAFNVADSAITVGVALFIVAHFVYGENSKK